MTVRCDQCGHENNPEYRFCGVCGAPLPPSIPAGEPNREPERARVSPVGGPSFLGLGDDRSHDLDYLLDDEPSRGHSRLYLALLLLVVSAGLLAWHWQRDGYPWEGLTSALSHKPAGSLPAPAPAPATPTEPAAGQASPTQTSPTQTSSTQTSPTQPPASEPIASPTSPSNQSATGTGEGATPAAAEAARPGNAEPPTQGQASTPNPITVVKPPEQAAEPPGGPGPGSAAAKQSALPSPGSGEPDPTEPAVPAKETPAVKQPTAPAVPTRKSAIPKPQPTIPSVSPEDRLVDEGERYLYGHGVRANCDLARRNLFIGAQQSNAKAQTLLGAMYATGHCVNRDLPTSYRWFAKALRGDPSNSRVQRDLEVLWKQMTPGERQLAMKSQ